MSQASAIALAGKPVGKKAFTIAAASKPVGRPEIGTQLWLADRLSCARAYLPTGLRAVAVAKASASLSYDGVNQ
jgi:hypothetical protein